MLQPHIAFLVMCVIIPLFAKFVQALINSEPRVSGVVGTAKVQPLQLGRDPHHCQHATEHAIPEVHAPLHLSRCQMRTGREGKHADAAASS